MMMPGLEGLNSYPSPSLSSPDISMWGVPLILNMGLWLVCEDCQQ